MIIYITNTSTADLLAKLDRISRIKKFSIKTIALQTYTALIHGDFNLVFRDVGYDGDGGLVSDSATLRKKYLEFIDAEMDTAGFKRYSDDSKLWIPK